MPLSSARGLAVAAIGAVLVLAVVCAGAPLGAEEKVGWPWSKPVLTSSIELTSGSVRGVVMKDSEMFLGIPFAAPPTGERRWLPPAPPKKWEGVLNMTTYGADCAQPHVHSHLNSSKRATSEDCLFINAYVPKKRSAPLLPAMLFFYGGSYEHGGSSFYEYDGEYLIAGTGDVVLFSSNYRLGPFGFLGSQELKADSPDGSTGTFGLQDQRAAMQFVRENAAAFGVDPDRITIFGQSAGGGSVSAHLVMPRSAGYFHRAAIESGSYANWTALSLPQAQTHFNRIAKSVNCSVGEAAAAQVVACMRSRSTEDIIAHVDDLQLPAANWGPVIDFVELLDHPATLVQQGNVARVPTLLGSNANEGTMFTTPIIPVKSSQAEVQAKVRELWGKEHAAELLQLFPFANFSKPFYEASMIVGDFTFGCPRRRTARWLSALDRSGAPQGEGVFAYYFAHTPVSTSWLAPSLKCFHGAELIFLFGIPSALWGSAEHALSKQIMQYWTNFAHTGNPNLRSASSEPTAVSWPPYSPDQPLVMQLDAPKLSVIDDNRWKTKECDWFDKNAPIA